MKNLFKGNRFSVILWVFFYFFIFALLLKGSFGYLDPDLGWHLKVGEEIVHTGSVPDVNNYNYTFTGTWVDHEWLSNALVYEIYSHWGYVALSIIFALLIVGILVILNIWAQRAYPEVSPFPIMLLQIFGAVASLPHFGVRMQETGLVFLVLILLVLNYYNKDKNWRRLLVLIPIMYLWACLHASFLIGFVIFFLFAGIKILEKLFVRYYKRDWLDFSGVLKWREIMIFSGLALLATTTTFFTPYRLKLYSFLNGYQDNFYQWHIQEWLPQFNYPFEYRQLFYLALVVIAVLLYIYYSRGNKKLWRLDLWTLGLTALFVLLSFKSRRHFPLMFVATFGFLISIFNPLFKIRPNGEHPEKSGLKKSWLKGYLLVCLFLAASLQLALTNFTSRPFLTFSRAYPVGAAEFLQARTQYDSLRLFNDYGWGGYLIWKLPSRRLFIDGRLPQVEYRGHSYLEEYFELFKKDGNISKKLADYNIGLVLIPVKDEEIRAKRWEQILFGLSDKNLAGPNYLRDYLSGSDNWQPIYYDRTAIIYKRIN